MWGLDRTDPRVAIAAMQAMNASVRNIVFAPAFFGTPFVLALTAILLRRQGRARAGALFGASSALYATFGMILTMAINVPMNEALGAMEVPMDIAQARDVWLTYSPDWQFWNQLRTLASGVSFLLAVAGIMALSARTLT
jgi:uncharacterized membrane protein